MKKIYKLPLFLFLFLFLFSINVLALVPTENFYVNDYVGILSDEQVLEMNAQAAALAEENGVQVVTVITENYVGSDPHAYATDIYNDFKIGSSEDDNGILLYVATEAGAVEIVTGNGMDYILPDSEVGNILDTYFIGPAQNNQLDKAIYDTFNALIDVGFEATTVGQNYAGSSFSAMIASAIGIFVLIMGILLCVFIVGNKKGKKPQVNQGQNMNTTPNNNGNGFVQTYGYDEKGKINTDGNAQAPYNSTGNYTQTNTYGQPDQYNQNTNGQPIQYNQNTYGQPDQYNQNTYGQPNQYNENGYGASNEYQQNPYPNEQDDGQYRPGKYANNNVSYAPRHNNTNFMYYGGAVAARRMYYGNRSAGQNGVGRMGGAGRSGGGLGSFRGGGGRSGGGGAGRSF